MNAQSLSDTEWFDVIGRDFIGKGQGSQAGREIEAWHVPQAWNLSLPPYDIKSLREVATGDGGFNPRRSCAKETTRIMRTEKQKNNLAKFFWDMAKMNPGLERLGYHQIPLRGIQQHRLAMPWQ